MTQCVEKYQLPSGQLWWLMRFTDGDKVSEMVFTFDGDNRQTWFYAKREAEKLLNEMGLSAAKHMVCLYEPVERPC